MPEQPNHCTGCGKLMADTNAAYYCSKACMDKVLGKITRVTQKYFCKKPKATHD